MKILAIIPARGGSKGVPNKNIAEVGGRPLIAWTIMAAREASCLDRIVVTTDSDAIADVARRTGAETPFLRPAELAKDDTPSITAILHAVQWLGEHDHYQPEFVMCLQPTSPLRTAKDIEWSVELVLQKNADSVVSVTLADHHPYWMKQIDADGHLQDFIALEPLAARRQDLPPAYALNGAIYLARHNTLLGQKTWYTDKTFPYIMPPERSLDIDTPWDFYLADLVLKDRAKT